MRRMKRGALTGLLRRYPVTIIVTGVTAVLGIPGLLSPAFVHLLEQDPAAIMDGQVWRLVTPVLVQGFGIGQYLFNLTGSALVGAAVERVYGGVRWLLFYLVAGVAAVALTSLWFPTAHDSGSSAAVGGLIGAFAVSALRSTTRPPWPATMYSALFASYLTVLALGGPVAGAIAGSVATPAMALVHRFAPARGTRLILVVLVLAAGAVMLADRDAHGVGIIAGVLLSARASGPGIRTAP